MAITDFAPVYRPVRSPFDRVFRVVAAWVAVRRANYARRVAVESLLLEPEHRLRDLGINRNDLTAYRLRPDDLIWAMSIHRK